jgi:hypothetical protein
MSRSTRQRAVPSLKGLPRSAPDTYRGLTPTGNANVAATRLSVNLPL